MKMRTPNQRCDAEVDVSRDRSAEIHRLFNELQKELEVGYEALSPERTMKIASMIDKLHHDFQDLLEEEDS